MLTAYDYTFARLFDQAGVDSILVGDSLAMVMQGHATTLPVTLDEVIYHGKLVCRAVERALVIVDLPFMTYQVSPRQAVRNAGRILKETGASAVKLEGGAVQADTIRALTRAEIPVMAHVGMRPQSIRKLGSHGRVQRDAEQLLLDSQAAQDAGAFGIVLELIPGVIAKSITAALHIPTIGIGAGPDCDGQVLVMHDMLGMTTGFQPRFVKRYAELAETIQSAARTFSAEVRSGTFPAAQHTHE